MNSETVLRNVDDRTDRRVAIQNDIETGLN